MREDEIRMDQAWFRIKDAALAGEMSFAEVLATLEEAYGSPIPAEIVARLMDPNAG